MDEDKKSLTEEIKEIKDALSLGKSKTKVNKLRFPVRAKVKRNKLKKGWIGIMRIGENQNVSFEKVQIEGGTYNTSDGTYHTSDGREILFFNGKFPLLVQEEKKINPYNFKFNDGHHETYGQKNIMATMLRDTIKVKKGGSLSPIIIVVVIIAIGYVLGKYVFKLF
jgi:hypothetical protein